MPPIHPDVLAVSEAVAVESPTRYVLLGEPREVSAGGPALLSALQDDLYARLYTRPVADDAPPADGLAQRDHIAALSAANNGTGTWEPGWTAGPVDEDGRVVVAKDSVTFWARPEGVRASERCRVRVGKELRHLLAGYYVAIGSGADDDGPEPLVRLYWHLTAPAAVPFIAAVTAALNARDVPFRAKVLADPGAYRRADAGVLYVARRHFAGLAGTLAILYERLAPGLRAATPLFTLSLAPGLALAEDPGGALSFGQHRCRLLAAGLWRSFEQGDRTAPARAAAVGAAFREAGLDPAAPHLEPGPAADYVALAAEIMLTASRIRPIAPIAPMGAAQAARHNPVPADRNAPSPGRKPVSDPAESRERFLAAAAGVGRALCRAAHWDGDGRLCNWVGRSARELAAVGGPIVPTAAALGPDLYAGSAGVALFLAELAAATGDGDCRRTALGAIARSIRQVKRDAAAHPPSLSFHSGPLGVARAAHRAAGLLGEPALDDEADALLRIVERAVGEPHVLDLLGGSAGAIPALLSLAREERWRGLRALAVRLGDELCHTAIRKGDLWAWDVERATGAGVAAALLTGLAHGASGLGLALLELHAATGRDEFLTGGRAAFAYEDTLFDPREGNWPDLRSVGSAPAPGRRYKVAWCHGAPGIGLARLRAASLDAARSDAHTAAARAALDTTAKALERLAALAGADSSLCHGVAGLAEVLLTGGTWLAEETYRTHARAAAGLLAGNAADSGWPSGAPSRGPNPSLMLGSAGVGYHFLRQALPRRVPPILLTPAHASLEP